MDIYFVRHGQTTGNVAKRHQAESTPLSNLGQEQSEKVAVVIKDLQPTHLISSHLVRAIETARSISLETGLDIEILHNVEELNRPRYLHGHKHISVRSVYYYFFWFLGIENKKLAGESYARVRQRIAMVQNELKKYPEDARIVVVSHSVFINMFLAHMCNARALSPITATKFLLSVFKIPNTKVVHVQYRAEAEKGVCKWRRTQP